MTEENHVPPDAADAYHFTLSKMSRAERMRLLHFLNAEQPNLNATDAQIRADIQEELAVFLRITTLRMILKKGPPTNISNLLMSSGKTGTTPIEDAILGIIDAAEGSASLQYLPAGEKAFLFHGKEASYNKLASDLLPDKFRDDPEAAREQIKKAVDQVKDKIKKTRSIKSRTRSKRSPASNR